MTVPPNIAITGLKPDLVIFKRQSSPPEVALLELTLPWDSSSGMEKARIRKDERYEKLTSDIEEQGFRCFNIPLEIGAGGFINNRNRGVISHICKIMNIRKVSQVLKNCSKLDHATHSQDWTSGQYLSPWIGDPGFLPPGWMVGTHFRLMSCGYTAENIGSVACSVAFLLEIQSNIFALYWFILQ